MQRNRIDLFAIKSPAEIFFNKMTQWRNGKWYRHNGLKSTARIFFFKKIHSYNLIKLNWNCIKVGIQCGMLDSLFLFFYLFIFCYCFYSGKIFKLKEKENCFVGYASLWLEIWENSLKFKSFCKLKIFIFFLKIRIMQT